MGRLTDFLRGEAEPGSPLSPVHAENGFFTTAKGRGVRFGDGSLEIKSYGFDGEESTQSLCYDNVRFAVYKRLYKVTDGVTEILRFIYGEDFDELYFKDGAVSAFESCGAFAERIDNLCGEDLVPSEDDVKKYNFVGGNRITVSDKGITLRHDYGLFLPYRTIDLIEVNSDESMLAVKDAFSAELCACRPKMLGHIKKYFPEEKITILR